MKRTKSVKSKHCFRIEDLESGRVVSASSIMSPKFTSHDRAYFQFIFAKDGLPVCEGKTLYSIETL